MGAGAGAGPGHVCKRMEGPTLANATTALLVGGYMFKAYRGGG